MRVFSVIWPCLSPSGRRNYNNDERRQNPRYFDNLIKMNLLVNLFLGPSFEHAEPIRASLLHAKDALCKFFCHFLCNQETRTKPIISLIIRQDTLGVSYEKERIDIYKAENVEELCAKHPLERNESQSSILVTRVFEAKNSPDSGRGLSMSFVRYFT